MLVSNFILMESRYSTKTKFWNKNW